MQLLSGLLIIASTIRSFHTFGLLPPSSQSLLGLYLPWQTILPDADHSSEDSQATKLFSDFWSWRLAQSPEFASLAGLTREHNSELEQFTEERFTQDLQSCQQFQRRAEALLQDTTGADYDNLEFFRAEVSVTFVLIYYLLFAAGNVH